MFGQVGRPHVEVLLQVREERVDGHLEGPKGKLNDANEGAIGQDAGETAEPANVRDEAGEGEGFALLPLVFGVGDRGGDRQFTLDIHVLLLFLELNCRLRCMVEFGVSLGGSRFGRASFVFLH